MLESFGGSSILRSETIRSFSDKLGRGQVIYVAHEALMFMSTMWFYFIVIVMCAEGVKQMVLGMIDVMVSGEQVVELGGVVVDTFHVLPRPLSSGGFWSGSANIIPNKVLEIFD